MSRAGISHKRPHHVDLVDLRLRGEGGQTGVRNLAILGGKAPQLRQRGDHAEAPVAHARAPQLHPLEALHLRHMLKASVADERTAPQVEHPQLVERLEVGQASIGEIVVKQDQLLEALDLRHRHQGRVCQIG